MQLLDCKHIIIYKRYVLTGCVSIHGYEALNLLHRLQSFRTFILALMPTYITHTHTPHTHTLHTHTLLTHIRIHIVSVMYIFGVQVCEAVLKYRTNRNPLIQQSLLALLPLLASFDPDVFSAKCVCCVCVCVCAHLMPVVV